MLRNIGAFAVHIWSKFYAVLMTQLLANLATSQRLIAAYKASNSHALHMLQVTKHCDQLVWVAS